MPMTEKKNCANCKHLSPPAEIRFENGECEERVICMAGEWSSSVLLLSVYKEHPKRYEDKAKRCLQYESSPVANSRLANIEKR